MNFLEEAVRDGTLWVVAGVLLTAVIGGAVGVGGGRRPLGPLYFTGIHLALLPVVVMLTPTNSVHGEVRLAALIAEAMAVVGCAGTLIFGGLLPLVGITASGILRDLVMGAATLLAGFAIAKRLEFSLSGIIATSAVLTAVIGFSLQDVLANVMGGLSLQMDRSIEEGDWVKIGDVAG